MKYFIGIVPPDGICQKVFAIQSQFGDNRLEPHITLRPPVTVTDKPCWIKAIEAVCVSFPAFEVSLPKTGNFGNRVLFIDVTSKQIESLHRVLIKAIEPFEQVDNHSVENRTFHPHLTLGRLRCGFTKQNFAEMKMLAEKYLSEEPKMFTANTVRLYHKPLGQGRYQTLQDVQLNPLP